VSMQSHPHPTGAAGRCMKHAAVHGHWAPPGVLHAVPVALSTLQLPQLPLRRCQRCARVREVRVAPQQRPACHTLCAPSCALTPPVPHARRDSTDRHNHSLQK
jgi:hypothetical protein